MNKLRIVSGQFLRIFKNGPRLFEVPFRNFQRTITGDKIRELDETTLTGRLLAYLNNEKTAKYEATAKVFEPSYQANITKFRQSDIKQVIMLIRSLGVRQNVREREKYLKLLNALDDECCNRVEQLDAREILEILHAFMKVIPNRIFNYKYYKAAVEELGCRIDVLEKNELVQLIFYIGLKKKLVGHNFLRKCINSLDEMNIKSLTAEELCIICNSAFKSSTKIENRTFLDAVVTYLGNSLHVFQDPALLITMLKTIRHHRCQTEDLLVTISCTIFFNKTLECYSFVALCHILALYSDFLYYDDHIVKAFTERCVFLLKENEFVAVKEYTPEIPRMKDIKRLLWCLSNLNCKALQATDIETVIVPNILSRFEAGELNNDPSSLVEIVLYLWMLNYRAYELMPYTLTYENIASIRVPNSPSRHRLNLLLSCIFYEDRGLFREFNVHPESASDYDPKFQMEKRTVLQRIADNLKELGIGREINKFEIGCQIPGLNIIGITGYRKNIYKAVHLEVLDEYTSLKNTEGTPTGLMQLKLRLLNGQEEGLVVIQSGDLESMTDEELKQVLLDEIELVC